MTVTGITVPAGGSALVIYETEVTRYAPLAAESSIVNTVTVTGGGLAAPVTAEETVGAVSSPRLSITKGLNPTVVAENGRITYTFTIQNTGNTPVTATDDVILRDTFDPVLNGLTVTYNGAPGLPVRSTPMTGPQVCSLQQRGRSPFPRPRIPRTR